MRQSRYIRILAIGLSLSVIVGTLVDFQFKIHIQRIYQRPHELTQFLGLFYAGLNAVSLLFQFGAAGWLLQRLGPGTSGSLQPGAVLGFASWVAMGAGGWVVVAMRWIQGILSQTLGKASTEIQYAAIRPAERRRIKPALDTLVERGSDALAGILLLIALRLLHASLTVIALGTATLSAVWLVLDLRLSRQFGRAFHESLSRRWIEPDSAPEFLQLPSARQALLEALGSSDERQALLALKLSQYSRDEATRSSVRRCLQHASAEVRAAAVETMEETRAPAPEALIESFLAEPHEGLRRAAIGYLVTQGPQPAGFARRLLEGDDPVLRQYLLDALFDRPCEARTALTWSWIDARLKSGGRDDSLLAARALGAMEGSAVAPRLLSLLTHPDAEIRRAALLSAARRPSPALLDALLPLLMDSEVGYEAHKAVAALGDPAVPGLEGLLGGKGGEGARTHAARALARIATPRALDSLMTLARSGDVSLRHRGLQGLRRARLHTGGPVLSRSVVHRLFLRELRDYRQCLAPAAALEKSTATEVRLLGESYHESADRALERALEALACWYDPKPLIGVFDRLKSRNPAVTAPALEYLGHVLPRLVFMPVSRVFETEARQTASDGSDPERLADWIRNAWETGDAWLRACAVRASRCAPDFDRGRFVTSDEGDPMVRQEIDALVRGHVTATPEPRC
jgi:HEAT repeat protein